jgi:TRAP-type C4-dicarboxylate transport system permease small subunit
MNDLTSFVKLADDCTGQSILPDLYGGLRGSNGTGCEVTVDSLRDVTVLIGNVIEILLSVAVFVAIGFIIYGGFRYITSSGDASGIKGAKDTIVNAIIGLIIAMVAFGVVRYITGEFVGGTF